MRALKVLAVVVLAVAMGGCTFLQPRQVVVHAMASEPSEKAKDLPICDTGGNWQVTTAVVNAGLDAFLLTQCRLCQLGYVFERLGLVAGGAAAEWMQRAQTNKVAGHRVAVPLGPNEGAPLVYTFQSPDGTAETLIIPQRYVEEAPPPLTLGLFSQALKRAAEARQRAAPTPK